MENSREREDTRSLLEPNSDNGNRTRPSMFRNIRILGANFPSRTAEGSRLLRDNFHTVMEEIRPLVEQARTVNQQGISLTNLLNRPTNSRIEPASRDSFVINLDESNNPNQSYSTVHVHNHSNENFLNNAREAHASLEQPTGGNNNNNNADNNEATAAEALRQVPEARALLEVLQKYVPFLLILIVKGFYDHREGIFNFIILFCCFCHSNSVVKREAAKQNRRSLTSLLVQVFYIFGCILLITCMFIEENMFSNLVFIPPYTQPLSVWDLLWTVGITDFLLKLFTIFVKIVIVALPGSLIAYQKRGKIYLLVEASSQLYRSLAPIQPWLYYLLESYQGAEKVAGVFLSAAYMVSKGTDLMFRIKLFKTAFLKAFQNVSLGSSPSKEQLQGAGTHCPICHDEYDCPVLLNCRHIFCEVCVSTWFDREQTCPLCRAKVVDDPSWRDGSTAYFTQLF